MGATRQGGEGSCGGLAGASAHRRPAAGAGGPARRAVHPGMAGPLHRTRRAGVKASTLPADTAEAGRAIGLHPWSVGVDLGVEQRAHLVHLLDQGLE